MTVLNDWQKQNGPSAWPGIQFDKLAHFLHLIWNELHRQERVSFPSAYKSANGIHGPGPALPKRRLKRHIFALQAIEHIQEALKDNPDVLLFDLEVTPHAGRKQYAINPGREQTSFMPVHLSTTLPRAWSAKDELAVAELIKLACNLTQEQIQMLGTHQSRKNTADAIEYNVFIQLFYRLFQEIEEIETGKSQSHAVAIEIPALEIVLDEVSKKAGGNKAIYSKGRQVIQKLADEGNKTAELAINKVFDSENSIWMADVLRWQPIYKDLKQLLAYVETLKRIRTIRVEEADLMDRSAGERGARGIAQRYQVELPSLPATATETYAWDELRRGVVKIFDSLPFESDSESRNDYSHRTETFRTML